MFAAYRRNLINDGIIITISARETIPLIIRMNPKEMVPFQCAHTHADTHGHMNVRPLYAIVFTMALLTQ